MPDGFPSVVFEVVDNDGEGPAEVIEHKVMGVTVTRMGDVYQCEDGINLLEHYIHTDENSARVAAAKSDMGLALICLETEDDLIDVPTAKDAIMSALAWMDEVLAP